MISGLRRASACTGRDSAAARLIGCSMNKVDADQARERWGLVHALPELGDAFDVLVLLVAVERGAVVANLAIENARRCASAAQGRQQRRPQPSTCSSGRGNSARPPPRFPAGRHPRVRPPPGRGRRSDQPGPPYAARQCRVRAGDRRESRQDRSRRDRASGPWRRCPARCAEHRSKRQAELPSHGIEDGAIEEGWTIGGH